MCELEIGYFGQNVKFWTKCILYLIPIIHVRQWRICFILQGCLIQPSDLITITLTTQHNIKADVQIKLKL